MPPNTLPPIFPASPFHPSTACCGFMPEIAPEIDLSLQFISLSLDGGPVLQLSAIAHNYTAHKHCCCKLLQGLTRQPHSNPDCGAEQETWPFMLQDPSPWTKSRHGTRHLPAHAFVLDQSLAFMDRGCSSCQQPCLKAVTADHLPRSGACSLV